jgi:hypothetical protein
MRERDRISSLQHRQELAEIEAAEKERIEAPIRAAEAKLNATLLELRKVEIEAIQSRRDDEIFLGELDGASMTVEQAAANNEAAANSFVADNADYRDNYKNDSNRDVLLSYLERNGVNIWSVAILNAAFNKLKGLGLLTENPAPAVPTPAVRSTYIPETPKVPETYEGWDQLTGLPRTYTKREAYLMSGDEYRRNFRIVDTSVPNMGPGPKGLR